MEKRKKYSLHHKAQKNLNKTNNDIFKKVIDDLTSSSSSTTTTTNNNIITTTNYFYSNYKTPKKNIMSIRHTKNNNQLNPKNLAASNINIYTKGKINKTIGNVNNIIINNNTNIINNNNTNIINNTFNDNNFVINDKEYIRSVSHFNIQQIDTLNNKNSFINNNIREKPFIMNKKKINQKNYIHVKNNNIINNNIINKKCFNKNKNFTYVHKYDKNNDNKNNNMNNLNNNNIDNDYIDKNNKINENDDKSIIFNVEELLMIEEKLSSLMKCLIDFNPCTEECFEFLNFYFTTKFCNNINKYFIGINFLQIIKKTMNFLLFSFILCYDISLHEDILPKYIVDLDELFSDIHTILILISKYFSTKIIDNSNIYVKKLQNLIDKYDINIQSKKSENQIFDEINILSSKLADNIHNLICKYNQQRITDIYNQINILSQNDLQRIFIDNIYINPNKNGSIIASSSYIQENKNEINDFVPVPRLKKRSDKQYTLVLDLDETLIHFKSYPNDDSSGLLQFRPFLSEFLSKINNYYELIVFTAATQDYADPIINAIEQKGTKFDYRLYRIHTRIIDNVFVKDLSRLGRDLSRIIIVDNMEQNYKLQPENGITIRPFWGKDTNDMALYDLFHILIKIVKQNMDVRDGIQYFKEDIISKVTSNIYRRVQF